MSNNTNPDNKTPNPGTKDALKAENEALKAELEALKAQAATAATAAPVAPAAPAAAEERVEITVPRGSANDEPNLVIAVNGVNYVLPKGKTSKVPKFVAEEFYRSKNAQAIRDTHIDEMLEASK